MNHPRPGDYGEPPDGDYARYVERLLQNRGSQHAAAPPSVATVKAVQPAVPARAGGNTPRSAPGKPALRLQIPVQWPLMLWLSFVLLMWFAPALLPLAIGAAVVAGVGYGVWKSRRGTQARDR